MWAYICGPSSYSCGSVYNGMCQCNLKSEWKPLYKLSQTEHARFSVLRHRTKTHNRGGGSTAPRKICTNCLETGQEIHCNGRKLVLFAVVIAFRSCWGSVRLFPNKIFFILMQWHIKCRAYRIWQKGHLKCCCFELSIHQRSPEKRLSTLII